MHMIINDVGQIIVIKITKGNIDDSTHVAELTKKSKGFIYVIKVISELIFSKLYTKEA